MDFEDSTKAVLFIVPYASYVIAVKGPFLVQLSLSSYVTKKVLSVVKADSPFSQVLNHPNYHWRRIKLEQPSVHCFNCDCLWS